MPEDLAEPAVSDDAIEPPPPEPTEASTGRKWFEVVFVTGTTILPFFWFGLLGFLHHREPDPDATFRDWNATGHFTNCFLAIVPAGMLILASPEVGSSRVDLQACKLEYSIVSPK